MMPLAIVAKTKLLENVSTKLGEAIYALSQEPPVNLDRASNKENIVDA